ncbi:hypothetical protein [Lysinibacillus sp. FJAT-14222]|uniref:hypothetical protein n=1 Tax=Lysinibacillus sp. FJAT-14222 TaxID=1932366 RepID=UPI0006AFBF0E|nr:hypothetical protein [Lysinibacillus sp. FJAT-14222]KOS63923.1 hypothetical protein AN161_04850 [Lysinibacillus sp. FJAT-14222]
MTFFGGYPGGFWGGPFYRPFSPFYGPGFFGPPFFGPPFFRPGPPFFRPGPPFRGRRRFY